MKERDPGIKWFNTVFYPYRKTCRAVRYEDGVLPRLRQTEVVLFTPWGPRYHWEVRGESILPSDKEVKVLHFLADVLQEWRTNMPGKEFRWLFLGADLYGSRINPLPIEVVRHYFDSLAKWLPQILPGAEFRLWSEFDEKAEIYRRKIWDNFDEYIPSVVLWQAEKAARVMGGNARLYLTERLAEAMFIEEMFRPIKISCVARNKDDTVDWELPRLYFLPEKLHTPWL